MKFLLIVVVSFLASINLNAYSYAAAGKEPTIDSKEAIIRAINSDDFKSAKTVFEQNSDNYKYLNDNFNSSLYDGLKQSILKNDKKEIVKWLDISVACEIQRRVDGALENIKEFNIAKVMLAKADKFYKILSVSLDKEKNETLKAAIKSCMDSIENPGLFGVGAKKADIEEYKRNQQIIIKILKSI
jgi:hypothetical protein